MPSTGDDARCWTAEEDQGETVPPGKPLPFTQVANPVVDLDGDEMTRIIWAEIKKKVCEEIVRL